MISLPVCVCVSVAAPGTAITSRAAEGGYTTKFEPGGSEGLGDKPQQQIGSKSVGQYRLLVLSFELLLKK